MDEQGNGQEAKPMEQPVEQTEIHHMKLALNGEGAGEQKQAGTDLSAGFEVLAITAGEGNGWVFSEAVLLDSLPLWDGVGCFVDHAQNEARPRSLRDLAGVLDAPQWDAERSGIRCRLRGVGPAAEVLEQMGRQMMRERARPAGEAGSAPRVGFSADMIFSAVGNQVQKITRVLSVDLVYNPARGGEFLYRVIEVDDRGPKSTRLQEAKQTHNKKGGKKNMAGEESSNAQAEMQEIPVEDLHQINRQLCEVLLSTELIAARLPQPVEARIRAQFSGHAFHPSQLTQAIAEARALVGELTAGSVVAGIAGGAGRIQGMVTGEEKFSAALYDLLGADRPAGLSGVRAARLSGIRELYTTMTGDVDFTGGYDSERAQFATSADLPGVLKNAMNKLIVQEWQELGRSGYRWWEPVVAVEHFTSLQQVTGVLVGEVTALPTVNEGAAYTALNIADSAETGAWTKYGGYVGITLEMFERDETHKLRQFPRKLASAGLRRISNLVGSVFTSAGGVGPNMADGNPVFGAGRGNLGTAALSGTSWEAASTAIYNQSMLTGAGGTSPKLALDARYLLVPRGLRLAARQILYPSWERESGIMSENMQRGEMGDVITCPEFTDANDWAAAADPHLAPGIVVAERFGLLPEIIIADGPQSGALFTNDEIRMKARHWLAVFVADFRPLYKANVA